jgi:hypothetical protein
MAAEASDFERIHIAERPLKDGDKTAACDANDNKMCKLQKG